EDRLVGLDLVRDARLGPAEAEVPAPVEPVVDEELDVPMEEVSRHAVEMVASGRGVFRTVRRGSRSRERGAPGRLRVLGQAALRAADRAKRRFPCGVAAPAPPTPALRADRRPLGGAASFP